MRKSGLLTLCFLISGLLCLPSCEMGGEPFQMADGTVMSLGGDIGEYMAFDSPAHRPHNKNDVRVKISTSNQALYVVEKDRVLLATPITTGYSGADSPIGTFRVFRKEVKCRANTHGWAHNEETDEYMLCKIGNKPKGWKFVATPMPYWMEFKSAYGMHTGFVYPYPKSHGCVRIHHNVTPKVFEMVQVGTPVNIAYSQPEDQTVGKDMKRPPNPNDIPDDPVFESSNEIFSFHKPVQFVD